MTRKRMSTYERRTKLSVTKDGYQVKSQYIKYDKASQLWIQHRKVVYLYWYKFLQHAEQGDYQVDWSKYELWGGKQTVMTTKFDDWWREHWQVCFSFTKGNPKDAPYHTKNNPKVVALRTALLIFENRHRGSKWDIGCWVRKNEISKGRQPPKSLTYAIEDLWTTPSIEEKEKLGVSRMRKNPRIRKVSEQDALYGGKERWVTLKEDDDRTRQDYFDWELKQTEIGANRDNKRRVQGYVSKFLKQADDLMTNIANGSLDPA